MENINFKKLETTDLKTMQKWLNTGFVNKWYGYGKEHFTYEDVERRYIPYISGEKPTHAYIITYDDVEIGYIQTYLINDYPDYSQYVKPIEQAAGLDLFIGEKDYIHRGLGKHIIIKFLKEYVFELTKAVSCIIGPEPNNKVAIRVYEKVGFKYLKTIQIPDEPEPEYLLKIEKSDVYN